MMRSLFAVFVSASTVSIMLLVSGLTLDSETSPVSDNEVARGLAEPEIEVMIEPLPDEVSNGTWCYLDARESTYSNGTIVQFYWRLYLKDVLKATYDEPFVEHKFRQIGLWKIFLTVTTNDSKTAMGFTAVVSIADADYDGLPDWWEMHYFNSTNQGGENDSDHDGFSNLQEYASGTDPSSKDPGAFLAMLVDNWYVLVAAAAAVAVAIAILYPKLKKKRKAEVKKQIEAAIEIEKALEEEK